MRRSLAVLLAAAAMLALIGFLVARNTTTQRVRYGVTSIDAFSVTGCPETLSVSPVHPSTSYSITTNGQDRRITGRLNRRMPPHTSLKVNLVAPDTAHGQGDVALGTTPSDLVTGISRSVAKDLAITFKLEIGEDAKQPRGRRVVTLSLSDDHSVIQTHRVMIRFN